MADCLCDSCAALCCRYFALPIDNPKTKREYDDIRWYLYHENVVIFIEKKQWYLGVMTRCKNLQADNRCGIYEQRPRICRGYSTDNCDYHGGEYDYEKLFTSGEQLMAYAREKLARKRRKRSRAAAAVAAKPRPGRVMGHPSLRKRKPRTVNGHTTRVVSTFGNGSGRLALPVVSPARRISQLTANP